MIIVKENKKSESFNASGRLSLEQFYKLVGKKTLCRTSYTPKPGFVTVDADPPAFYGINNGFFYIAAPRGLNVNFQLRALTGFYKEDYDDGTATDYMITVRDGTQVHLNLLS